MSNLVMLDIRRAALYNQVAQILENRICDGTYPNRTFLPNEYALSLEFQVSMGTIRRAVDELMQKDLIERKPGRGTFIKADLCSSVRKRFNHFEISDCHNVINWHVQKLTCESIDPSNETRQALSMSHGEKVIHYNRVRFYRDNVRMFEDSYIPAARFPDFEPVRHEGSDLLFLVQNYGIRIGNIIESVTPALCSEEIADLLGIQAGTPLLKLRRTTFDRDQAAVEYKVALTHLEDASVKIAI